MRQGGFTLIELLVVMAALGVLLSLAAPRYAEHVDRSREVVLRHNLAGLRHAIDQFHADRGRYPTDIEELVRERYLREIPLDPMTERRDSWLIVASPSSLEGMFDVKSGAAGIARDGSHYVQW